MIYSFLCGFICVSLGQSFKIKPRNMYIASTRAQFKINTHGCWNWHLCIPDELSVVQCSLRHVIGIVFFYTISVAWNDCAGQLAAGGVVSVWRLWVQSLPGPRWFIRSFVGLYAFPWARASKLNQEICILPAPGRSSKLTHTGVEIDTCAFQTGCQLSSAASGMSLGLCFFYTISVAWNGHAGQLAAGGVVSVWRFWVQSLPGPRWFIRSFVGSYAFPWDRASKLKQEICILPALGRSSKLTHTGVEIDTCAFQTGCQFSSAASGMSLGCGFFLHNFSGMKWSCWTTGSWRCCLGMEVVSSILAGSTIIYQFLCGFICVSLGQSFKIKPRKMYNACARAQFKITTHRCWNW